MKKNMVLIIIAIVIIVIISVYFEMMGRYILALKINWSITIPNGKKLIFNKNSEPSFHGDGQDYAIFEYNNRNLQKLKENIEWNKNKNIELENKVIKLLDYIEVPKQNYPNFDEEYLYYYDKQYDSSELYLILINKNMYLIENLL